MSRTLHPDRNGEDSRAAFELLTKAKDCLQEADRRHLYLEQMLQVAQISPSLVDMSHASWVKRRILREALQKVVSAEMGLEAQFNMRANNGLKGFKRYVTGLLESGKAASWLSTLDEHERESHHGDTN